MNSDFIIKIGDLGLIKPLGSSNSSIEQLSENPLVTTRKISEDLISVSSHYYSNSNSGACGTINYASPEQLSDSLLKIIDFKSDIYSLGIVFL